MRVQTFIDKVLQMGSGGQLNSYRAPRAWPVLTSLASERAYSVISIKQLLMSEDWRLHCSGSLEKQAGYYLDCWVPFRNKQTPRKQINKKLQKKTLPPKNTWRGSLARL